MIVQTILCRERPYGLRPGEPGARGERRITHACGDPLAVDDVLERSGKRRRCRIADDSADSVLDQFCRTTTVAASDDGFAAGERLRRDEAIVLRQRRKAHDTATRQVAEDLVV